MKDNSYQGKAQQGMSLLKEAVYESIKSIGRAGYTEIARDLPALRFDIEKLSHKGWFVSEIVQQLEKDGRVTKVGKKWQAKQSKAKQGLEALKEAIYETIKNLGTAGYTEIARNIPALRFDIEKPSHKGWFVSEIVQQLEKDGRVIKAGRKWRAK